MRRKMVGARFGLQLTQCRYITDIFFDIAFIMVDRRDIVVPVAHIPVDYSLLPYTP